MILLAILFALSFAEGQLVNSGLVNDITDVIDVHSDVVTLEDAGEHYLETQPNYTRFFTRLRHIGYNSYIRPGYHVRPVVVKCSLFINSISAISESDMDFTVDLYFRQTWWDHRLAWLKDALHKDEEGHAEVITLSGNYYTALWRPDTFFVNEKNSWFHRITSMNSFVRIMPDGHVTQSYRLTVQAICHMTFKLFPLDHQRCGLHIESFAHPYQDIQYSWSSSGKGVSFSADAMGLLSYVIFGFQLETDWNIREDGLNHSRLLFHVCLARSVGYYIIQIYVPSALIVIISWISFWIPRSKSPARVTLGVTTVLTMVTFTSHGFKSGLPNISYLKAMDIFLLFGFIMVFLALLEFALVSYVTKKVRQCKAMMTADGDEMSDYDEYTEGMCDGDGDIIEVSRPIRRKVTDGEAAEDDCMCHLSHSIPSRIEWVSRFGFPIAYIIFNVIYWHYYLDDDFNKLSQESNFVELQRISSLNF